MVGGSEYMNYISYLYKLYEQRTYEFPIGLVFLLILFVGVAFYLISLKKK